MAIENMLFTPKNLSLIVLVIQNISLVMTVRYAKLLQQAPGSNNSFVSSTVIVSSECLKLVLNLIIGYISHVKQQRTLDDKKSHISYTSVLRSELMCYSSNGGDSNDYGCLKLAGVAILYVLQNNFLFVALGNLSVPVYQVTAQGKILTTALLSQALLNKKLSRMQYFSLFLLAVGVAIVQLSTTMKTSSSATRDDFGDDNDDTASDSNTDASTNNSTAPTEHEQNTALGLIAVAICCLTSSFAGVYFERVLKKKPSPAASTENKPPKQPISVYVRNVQLAAWSIPLALMAVIFNAKDLEAVTQNGFFHGYTHHWIVMAVILNQAGTGFIVSLVVQFADNILKGFATSIAIVLSTALSVRLFHTHIHPWFLVGAVLVISAVPMYAKYPPDPQVSSAASLPMSLKPDQPGKSSLFCGLSRFSWLLSLCLIALSIHGYNQVASSPHRSADNNGRGDSSAHDIVPASDTKRHSCPAAATSGGRSWEVITEFVGIFNEVGCPYFIHAGTLLDFVRDCDIKTSDVDFAIPLQWWSKKENQEALTKATRSRGKYERAYPELPHWGIMGQFGYEEAWTKHGVKVDLFSVIEEEKNFIWSLWYKSDEVSSCFAQRSSVEEFEWGNLKIRAPQPFDAVLTSFYGEDWRKPFPGNWVWNVHPFTVGSCTKDPSKKPIVSYG